MMNFIYKLFTEGDREELDAGTKKLIISLTFVVILVAVSIPSLLTIDYLGHQVQSENTGKPPAASANEKERFNYGTFGDFFGGVLNPILTFGTFTGLAITTIYQRIGMRASRLQAFETTLFNMLELHNQIAHQLRFDSTSFARDQAADGERIPINIRVARAKSSKMAEGRAVFNAVLNALKTEAAIRGWDLVKTYKEVLQDKHNYVLGHYFRNLYQILRLIKRNQGLVLSKIQAQEYSAVVRSQLSSYELALLFLNCQRNVSDQNEKFKKLIVEFEMLEHLPLKADVLNKSLDALDFSADAKYFKYYIGGPASNTIFYSTGAYGTNPEIQTYLKALHE